MQPKPHLIANFSPKRRHSRAAPSNVEAEQQTRSRLPRLSLHMATGLIQLHFQVIKFVLQGVQKPVRLGKIPVGETLLNLFMEL